MADRYNKQYVQKIRCAALAAILVCSCIFSYPIHAQEETYQIASFTELDTEQRALQVPYGTVEEDIPFPDTLEVQVQNTGEEQLQTQQLKITWQCTKSYDGKREQEQTIWRPCLPEGYRLSEAVEMPTLSVTVQSKVSAAPINRQLKAVLSATGVMSEAELENAIAINGASIQLGSDIPLTKPLEIANSVSIDLNGHKLYRELQYLTSNGMVIKVSGEAASLTVTDTSTDHSGEISGGKNNAAGGGVYVGQGATFIMHSGSIRNNETYSGSKGGGIYATNATVKLHDSAVIENNTALSGAGIYLADTSSLFMDGGIIQNNIAGNSGGGGISANNSSIDLHATAAITNNTANAGGGVWVENSATINMDGGHITGNTASSRGGGIGATAANVELSGNAEVGNNTNGGAYGYGGGIYMNSSTSTLATLTIDGQTRIHGNTATYGGGIYVDSVHLTMRSGTIENNTGRSNSGGIGTGGGVIPNVQTLDLQGGTIRNNKIEVQASDSNAAGVCTNDRTDLYIHGNITILQNKDNKEKFSNLRIKHISRPMHITGPLTGSISIANAITYKGKTQIADGGEGYTVTSSDLAHMSTDTDTNKIRIFDEKVYICFPYKLTFSRGNNGTGADIPKDVIEGDQVDLPVDSFTAAGYELIGWNTSSSASTALPSYTMPNEDSTLYAIWKPINYTIRYHANGGQGEMEDQTLEYDQGMNLSRNAFTLKKSVSFDAKGGQPKLQEQQVPYSFLGWAKTAEGEKEYNERAYVNNLTTVKDTVIDLYAVWNTKGISLPSSNRAGYQLEGWYRDEAYKKYAGKAGGTYKPIANNQPETLYAKWKDITAPSITADTTASGWVKEAVIHITYEDNEKVTKLSVKTDANDYEALEDFAPEGSGYSFTGFLQGTHTYRFQAEDAQGNTAESESIQIQYDTVKPEITDAAFHDVHCTTAELKLRLSEDVSLYTSLNPDTQPDTESMKKTDPKQFSQGEAALSLTELVAEKENILYVMAEDAAGNLSEIKKLVVYTKPETPDETAYTIQYDAERLLWDKERYEISANREFSTVWDAGDLKPFISESSGEDQTLYIRVKQKGNLPASDSYAIRIPKRRKAPAVAPLQVSGSSIIAKQGLEYSLDNWNTVNTTGEFKELSPGTSYKLLSRSACTESEFVSEAAEQEVKTLAVMKLSQEGSGSSQSSVALDKQEGHSGDVITASITTTEEYTPHIQIAGQPVSPQKISDTKWTFSYTIQEQDQTIRCLISYDDRQAVELTGTKQIHLPASHEANTSAEAVLDYLTRTYRGTVAYDNGTKKEAALSYELQGTYDRKYAVLTGTASYGALHLPVTVTIQRVHAKFEDISLVKKVEAEGYTSAQTLGLPAQISVILQDENGDSRIENYAVSWDAIPNDFGKQEQQADIHGMVQLPEWASGSSSITAHVLVENKENISSKLRVTLNDWTYGDSPSNVVLYEEDAKLSNSHADIHFSGTASNGDAYTGHQIPTQSGSYTAHIHYEDSTRIADVNTEFEIRKRELSVIQGTLMQKEKHYDKTTQVKLSGQLQPIGILSQDDVTVEYASAQMDQPDAGLRTIQVNGIAIKGEAASNYSCKQQTLSIPGFVFQADGKENPAYKKSYETITAMHIITNITKTPADIVLPEHWSLAPSVEREQALAGNSAIPKQPFALRYTSANSNYKNVEDVYRIPVSTITIGFLDGLHIRKIPQPQEQIELVPQLTVTGAPLPDNGPYALDQLVWMNTAESIVRVDSHGLKRADLTGLKKGLSMVGIRYPESAVLGYVLVQVEDTGSLSANKTQELETIADILDSQIAWDSPSETDRTSVNLVTDEITKLKDKEKQELDKEVIEKLDDMKQKVNKDLIINVHTDQKSKLEQFQIIGIAIASGVDEGVVDVYATSSFTDERILLELDLKLQVNNIEKQLQSPLFFTMQVPEGWNPLYLYHRHDNGAVEQLEYTRDKDMVHVRMDSFSSLVFMKEPYTQEELERFANHTKENPEDKDKEKDTAPLSTEKTVVNSGDATDRMIWYFLMAASFSILVTSAWFRRKANRRISDRL